MASRAAARGTKRNQAYKFEIVPETNNGREEETKKRPKKRRADSTNEANHPRTWFDRETAEGLWMLSSSSLRKIQKHATPDPDQVLAPMLTSWFDLSNYTNVSRASALTPPERMSCEELPEGLCAMGELSVENDKPVNSILKLRLYPSHEQRAKLEQMFSSNRAVYNKLVAQSKIDCRTRLVLQGKENKDTRMTLGDLQARYRPIAYTKTMAGYFRNNKKALARHSQVQDEVRDSAFRDFMKAVKSSLALFFALKKEKKTSFPELRFKSKFAFQHD